MPAQSVNKRPAAPSRGSREGRDARRPIRTGWWIVASIVIVVAVAAVVAVRSGGDDAAPVASGTEQTRPVLVSGTPLPILADTGTDPALGLVAPTLTGQSFDGSPVSVRTGAPTLIIFLAHWCPHCRREVPLLVQWNLGVGVPSGVEVVGVATATNADRPNYPPSVWLHDAGFPWPVLADSERGDAATAMGLPGFPFFVLLDANGTVRMRQSGEIEPATLAADITAALAA